MYARENKLTSWNLIVAMTALFIGGFFGPLQKLQSVGLNLYPTLNNFGIKSYYQGLTAHGYPVSPPLPPLFFVAIPQIPEKMPKPLL